MASFWKALTGFARKSATPDWGTLERYMAWAFGVGASASGIVVNPQTAMQSAAVYSSIKVLAESIGMLPMNLYKKSPGNVRTLMADHPLHTLCHDQPNDWQTSVEFWEMMVVSLSLRGNAFAYVNRTRSGRVAELLPLHPDMVRVNMGSNWALEYQITMPDSTFRTFGPGEIFHVRGLTLNGWMGISPIAYARESIGLALATEKFGGQLFRNGAKMGGVLEHPGSLSKDAYERIKNSFDEASSGENSHKTAILEEGMKFAKVSMSADDSQFLETRKYQRSEIAAIFRVPPHMIGDLEKATFSNIEQQSLEFVNYSLMPWLVRIEKAIKRDLMTQQERRELTMKYNVSGLLRGDAAGRSALYHAGILDGWMTRNEARASESEIGIIYNPIDGLDLPLIPLNMSDGTDDPDEAADAAAKEPPAKPTSETKLPEDKKP
jgi:HK97 family phage portal protein